MTALPTSSPWPIIPRDLPDLALPTTVIVGSTPTLAFYSLGLLILAEDSGSSYE